MRSYILLRLALMVPTLLGIMVLNFVVVQAAPGGPVERAITSLTSLSSDATSRISGAGGSDMGMHGSGSLGAQNAYRGARGLDPEVIAKIEKIYGFDQPPLKRLQIMIGNYLRFDFGESFVSGQRVIDTIMQTLPVTLSLGLWTTLIVYLISIPLGIRKAVRHGSRMDVATSVMLTVAYAVPSFLLAIALIVFFAGGTYVQWFPLKGLVSDNWADMPWPDKILDYLWHMVLPVGAMVVGGFASLTMLTKNCFLEEIQKQYVTTARAKGLGERRILMGHVFRNAMLIVIAGFPQALLKIVLTSALLIEIIFSLNGLGLLGYEAVINRDYPIIFGTLYIFTLLGLIINLLSDIVYTLVDPRIDFTRREVAA